MNWQVISQRIFYFLVLLCMGLGTGCQKPKELGLNLQPVNDKIKVYYTDTITVKSSSVLLDSVISSNPATILSGQYTDPLLGKTSARSFVQFKQLGTQDTVTVNANAQVDSLVFYMRPIVAFGDTSKTQRFYLYRLSESLFSQNYYIYNEAAYDSNNLLGTIDYRPGLQGFSSYATCYFPKALQDELMSLFRQKTLGTDFVNIFKGIAIVPDPSTNASIVSFSMGGTGTQMIMYYHYTDASGNVITLQNAYYANPAASFVNLKSDWSGGPLSGLDYNNRTKEASLTNNLSYIQSGLGLVTKLEFPYLDHLKTLGKVSINKADLVFYNDPASTSDVFPVPTQLTLYRVSKTNRIALLSSGLKYPVQDETKSPYSVANPVQFSYNTKGLFFKNTITTFFQLYFLGQEQNNNLFISEQYDVLSGNTVIANFIQLRRMAVNNNPNSSNKIRLELFYTVVK